MIPNLSNVKLICKVVHGSRLYKLHSNESDYDEKGLFLPKKEDCLLNRAPKNITWKEPEQNKEHELFSLTEFVKHVSRGEGYAIDMLHCSNEDIIKTSPLFEYLRENKSRFYTRKMVGLLGFTKTQAAKYCLKAERLNAVKVILKFLQEAESKGIARLWQVWEDFPIGEHIFKGEEETNRNADKRFVEVVGKKFPATITPSYAIPVLENLISSYGERTQKASELDAKDVKSLSHSFRTAYQLKHIYLNGGFNYPLPETEFLKAIKYRKLDYRLNKLDDMLNELVTEIENLAEKSCYPERVDAEWLDNLILNEYEY